MNIRGLFESQGLKLGRFVGPEAISSVSGVGSQDTFLENAEGDVSRVMILRLSRIYKGRGKLVRAREKAGRG